MCKPPNEKKGFAESLASALLPVELRVTSYYSEAPAHTQIHRDLDIAPMPRPQMSLLNGKRKQSRERIV